MKKNLLTIFLACLAWQGFSQVTGGLLAKYSFNNGNANDDAGNHDGTVNGATLTTDRFGNVNAAYAFDPATQQYIEVPYSPDFTPGLNPISVSLWFRSSANDSSYEFMADWYRCGTNPTCASGDAAAYSIALTDSGKVYYDVRDDNGTDEFFTTSLSYNDDAWHNAVLVFDPTADYQVFCYLDNVAIDSVSSGIGALNDGGYAIPFSIGRHFETGWGVPVYYFDGRIDDIRFYGKPLSAAEIDTLYNETDPITTGTEDAMAETGTFSVTPNPAQNDVTINLANVQHIAEIELIDISGSRVKTIQKKNNIDLNISDLPEGFYFIRATTTDGLIMNKKLVVSR